MEEEHLSLIWNNYGMVYRHMLNMLRVQNVLTDVSLACEGEIFKVHKLVLVTCSNFFKSLLEDAPCEHPIVYLRGVSAKEMNSLIEFMYLGSLNLAKHEVADLLTTAEALQIKGLGVLHTEKDAPNETSPSTKKRKLSPEPIELDYVNLEPMSTEGEPQMELNGVIDVEKNVPNTNYDLCFQSQSESQDHYNDASNPDILDDFFASNKVSLPPFSSTLSEVPKHPPMLRSSKSRTKETRNTVPLTTLQVENYESSKPINYCMSNVTSHRNERHANFPTLSESTNPDTFDIPIKQEKIDKALDFTFGACAQAAPMKAVSPLHEPNPPNKSTPAGARNTFNSEENVSATPLEENAENVIDTGRPFTCPICQKTFAKTAILKRHHLAHFRPYVCHLCQRSFTRKEVLAEHLLEHDGTDLRLPCPVCQMTIKRKRNLQAHIKVKHPEYHKQRLLNR